MSHRVIRRLAAVVMLGGLGSGFALPGLDELLYHRAPAGVHTNFAHLDRPGGCDSHAEHCIADAILYAPRLAALPQHTLPTHTAFADPAVATLASDPRSPNLYTLQQPRAPPADLT